MNILNEIVKNKGERIALSRERNSVSELTKMPLFKREPASLKQSIVNGSGLIAEFKRKSPSFGLFPESKLEDQVEFYESRAVSGISVLTDENYFGGSCLDLTAAREVTELPILRKDFIIDEYQLFEAKAHGADAVLLIASILDDYYAEQLALIAKSINLEVLMEVHCEEDLSKINANVDIIGVNNRNLDTLKTDLNVSVSLASKLPFERLKISESGIRTATDIRKLSKLGYEGFLVGESIMKKPATLEKLLKVKSV